MDIFLNVMIKVSCTNQSRVDALCLLDLRASRTSPLKSDLTVCKANWKQCTQPKAEQSIHCPVKRPFSSHNINAFKMLALHFFCHLAHKGLFQDTSPFCQIINRLFAVVHRSGGETEVDQSLSSVSTMVICSSKELKSKTSWKHSSQPKNFQRRGGKNTN